MRRKPLSLPRNPMIPNGLQNIERPDTATELLVPEVPAPVERITGVWRFVRRPGGQTRVYSLPGHLLQLIERGRFTLRTLGMEYAVESGMLLYYHEAQEVEWLDVAEPVSFISVGFVAHAFPPPPENTHARVATPAIRRAFKQLLAAANTADTAYGAPGVYAGLYSLLAEIARMPAAPCADTEEGRTWWEVERTLRRQGRFRATMRELCDIGGKSPTSIIRACHSATGLSPMQRLKALRMGEAMGLVRYSGMNVSQIAEYLGYSRIHEFSREFSAYFGVPPSRAGQGS